MSTFYTLRLLNLEWSEIHFALIYFSRFIYFIMKQERLAQHADVKFYEKFYHCFSDIFPTVNGAVYLSKIDFPFNNCLAIIQSVTVKAAVQIHDLSSILLHKACT